jgi:hypothetical protein
LSSVRTNACRESEYALPLTKGQTDIIPRATLGRRSRLGAIWRKLQWFLNWRAKDLESLVVLQSRRRPASPRSLE